jgi:hypothetical protein
VLLCQWDARRFRAQLLTKETQSALLKGAERKWDEEEGGVGMGGWRPDGGMPRAYIRRHRDRVMPTRLRGLIGVRALIGGRHHADAAAHSTISFA